MGPRDVVARTCNPLSRRPSDGSIADARQLAAPCVAQDALARCTTGVLSSPPLMSDKKTSILFVDDDPNILAAMRRRLQSRRNWEPVFVGSAAEATEALSARSFDVVATDLHMPNGDGASLLAEVRRRWPSTFRIVLSGTVENTAVLSTIRDAHFFLGKPFELETLQAALDCAVKSRRQLADPELANFGSGVTNLPSLPAIYERITEAIADETMSVKKIGDLIAGDVSMTGKILRLVNSGFVGAPKKVASPGEAAVLLGVELVRSLVLGSSVYASVDGQLAAEGGLDCLWQHSLAAARATRAIATVLRAEKAIADAAYQAAILHEVGRLVFLVNKPEDYLRYRREYAASGDPTREAEIRHLGCHHEKLGGYVLATWSLAENVVRAVSSHRAPVAVKGIDATCLLHLADSLCDQAGYTRCSLNREYLERMGLSESLDAITAAVASAEQARK